MKKKSVLSLLLAVVIIASLVCFAFATGEAAPVAGAAVDANGEPLPWYAGLLSSPIPMLIVMFLLFYFLLIRPENKKKKEVANMRAALKVGDVITTIGGIMGRITSVKEEYIVIETASDKNKIKLAKWSVSTVDKKKEKPGKDTEVEEIAETTETSEQE